MAVLLFSVHQQMNGDTFRTHAGCIVPVIPDLVDLHLGFRQFMSIGYIVTVHLLVVAVHRCRYDGVSDLFSIGIELWKAGDLIGPVSIFVRLYLRCLLGNTVRQYAYSYLRRPLAVLVVVVLPGDRSGNRSLIRITFHRDMPVGDIIIVIV